MNEPVANYSTLPESPSSALISEEEFFENSLFHDIMEMSSIPQVAEKTAYNLKDLQDEVYQSLFNIYQRTRGITSSSPSQSDEIFNIFELFFKNYYQHFREGMEKIAAEGSSLKIAYYLGKNSGKLLATLDQFIAEMEQEL